MSDYAARKTRPQFRNIAVWQILSYRLPAAGVVSILHRISGALLFLLGLPFALFLFDQSITSELSFERYRDIVTRWPGKVALVILGWAFAHHAVAGIRYLLLDVHVGVTKQGSRTSARAVLALSLGLTLVWALWVFDVI